MPVSRYGAKLRNACFVDVYIQVVIALHFHMSSCNIYQKRIKHDVSKLYVNLYDKIYLKKIHALSFCILKLYFYCDIVSFY